MLLKNLFERNQLKKKKNDAKLIKLIQMKEDEVVQ